MKSIVLLFSLLFASRSSAQILFEAVLINPCTGELSENGREWYLSDSLHDELVPNAVRLPDSLKRTVSSGGGGYAPDPFYVSHGVHRFEISVPPGTYLLHFADWYLPPVEVNLQGSEVIRDTFYTEMLLRRRADDSYEVCGSPATGKLTDHYFNGSLRISGTFENGKPVDTVRTYYQSGQLYQLLIPGKEGERTITWHQNGTPLSDNYFGKHSFAKEYSESGLLTYSNTHKKGTEEFAYYPYGRLKEYKSSSEKRVYDNNGVLREKITRKEKYLHYRKNFRVYRYKWISYTSAGKRDRKLIFYNSGIRWGIFPDSTQELINDYVRKVISWQNGRKKTRYKLDNQSSPGSETYIVYTKSRRWRKTGTLTSAELREALVVKRNL